MIRLLIWEVYIIISCSKFPTMNMMKSSRLSARRHVLSNLQDIVGMLDNGTELFVLQSFQKGVSINVKDSNGNSLLHLAVARQDFRRVKLLVYKGCDVNCENNVEQTALNIAVKLDNFEISKFLINQGVDVKRDTSNIILEAIWNKNSMMTDLLLEHGAAYDFEFTKYLVCEQITSTPVLECIKLNVLDILDLFLEKVPVNLDKQLELCYINALDSGCEYLISKGANPFKPLTIHQNKSMYKTLFGKLLCDYVLEEKPGLLRPILREYGFSISSVERNCFLKQALSCRFHKGVSLRVRIVGRSPDTCATHMLSILILLCKIGLHYHDFSSVCECDSRYGDKCVHISNLRLKLSEESVKERLFIGRVHTLQFQCRRAIRETWTFGVSEKIQQLPLPKSLKDFLKFVNEI